MKRVTTILSLICGLVFSTLWPASAQAEIKFEYVVKFICGPITDPVPLRLVPGTYATSVNIYNLNDRDVELNKNIALTFPPGAQTAGAVSDIIVETLPAKTALQVDCEVIPSGFYFTMDGAPDEGFTEGFLVIHSQGPLEVSAVYTATDSTTGASVDVEQIQGVKRRVRRRDRDQLTICHIPPGNPAARHTLRIGSPAWPAHASHGDTQGACTN